MATASSDPRPAVDTAPPKRDFRQEVTDQIISMLENGAAPWQKQWTPGESPAGMPVNPTADRNYRGRNALHLMATVLLRGYNDPRWMTYKQAADQGWQVRRSEKGTQIEFWDVKPADKDASPGGNDGSSNESNVRNRETRLVHRVYTVFNAKQIDGIPDYQPKRPTSFEIVNAAEKILDNSGAKINHERADQAFYNRATDSIQLPPKDVFKDAAGYYGTALHELAHNAAARIMPRPFRELSCQRASLGDFPRHNTGTLAAAVTLNGRRTPFENHKRQQPARRLSEGVSGVSRAAVLSANDDCRVLSMPRQIEQ